MDAEGDLEAVQPQIDAIASRNKVLIKSRAEIRSFNYNVNGGLLFLGLIVGITLLVTTFLMIYFKQMFEGYDDRENFLIMKQVGLEDAMIRKTIQSQIKWVFIQPILVAAIHSLISSKIVFNTLGFIGIRDYPFFITNYILVILAVALAYGLMYLLTARRYYGIVSGQEA